MELIRKCSSDFLKTRYNIMLLECVHVCVWFCVYVGCRFFVHCLAFLWWDCVCVCIQYVIVYVCV